MNNPVCVPCPWCKSVELSMEYSSDHYIARVVECNNCEASGPPILIEGWDGVGPPTTEAIEEASEKARVKWNEVGKKDK